MGKTCIMRTLTSVGLIQVRFTENVARKIGFTEYIVGKTHCVTVLLMQGSLSYRFPHTTEFKHFNHNKI